MDIVDSKTRSAMMSRIRDRNTQPEVILRHALHSRGLRYRLHVLGLPGRPDIVIPRHKAVIFVHGCFWHRHDNCKYATVPGTRAAFWQKKFASNVTRDQANVKKLLNMNWRVAIVWECEIRKKSIAILTDRLLQWLQSNENCVEVPKSEHQCPLGS